MSAEKKKKSQYIIRMEDSSNPISTYRVSEELFFSIKRTIEPYRSFKTMPKKVRCIETGEIFRHSKEATTWLISKGKSRSYDGYIRIKDVCNGRKEQAFGYHWEFVE